MKKEIADMWVEALTSGEYKQTHSQLRDEKGFCCLGVLCNLHAQNHPEIAEKQRNPKLYMMQELFLPAAVRKWAGMKSNNGDLPYSLSLAVQNDYGLRFQKIAQIIRDNWEKL